MQLSITLRKILLFHSVTEQFPIKQKSLTRPLISTGTQGFACKNNLIDEFLSVISGDADCDSELLSLFLVFYEGFLLENMLFREVLIVLDNELLDSDLIHKP